MMSKKPEAVQVTGSCLCGKVEYKATGPFTDFRYCHCERCRKATGSAHAANLFLPKEQFAWISGEKEVTLFIHAQAENYPRGFCRHCGSMVPRPGRDSRYMVIPAGTLDTDAPMLPTKNIFWRLRASWYKPVPELPTFDERP